MNQRQSLKKASKRIEDLEIVMARAKADIVDYNTVILGMIEGGSPCPLCEDWDECQLQAKTDGKGCPEWLLRHQREEVASNDASERVLPANQQSGNQAVTTTGQIKAF